MDKLFKNVIAPTILVFLLISGLMIIYKSPATKVEDISLSKLVNRINAEEVKQIEVSGSDLKIELNDGTKEKATKEMESSLVETLANYDVNKEALQKVNVVIKSPSGASFWAGVILPFLLPIIIIIGFLWFMMRQAQRGNSQAMSFGMRMDR